MKIVVIGGSGLIGTKLVNRLREKGHEVVAASHNSGVNTITSEGLAEALAGAQVVVDVANSPSFEDKAALAFFETSGRNPLVMDRQSERVLVVASAEGGMELEEIAVKKPGSILRQSVEPAVGMVDFQAREIAFGLKLPASLTSQAVTTIMGAYRAFHDYDATMAEINPLVVTKDGRLLALDAKMGFDDNALFRHSNISELRDKTQEDPREMAAADRGLSYVGLDGNIGCIINGAGLAGHHGHESSTPEGNLRISSTSAGALRRSAWSRRLIWCYPMTRCR